MAGISNEVKARRVAEELGVELTPEPIEEHDQPTIEVWTYNAHLTEVNNQCHMYFARGNTWAQAWKDAYEYITGMTEACDPECECWGEASKLHNAVDALVVEKTVKQLGLCKCGCGDKVSKFYRPGHDARHVSQLLKLIRLGRMELDAAQEQLPSEPLRAKMRKAATRN